MPNENNSLAVWYAAAMAVLAVLVAAEGWQHLFSYPLWRRDLVANAPTTSARLIVPAAVVFFIGLVVAPFCDLRKPAKPDWLVGDGLSAAALATSTGMLLMVFSTWAVEEIDFGIRATWDEPAFIMGYSTLGMFWIRQIEERYRRTKDPTQITTFVLCASLVVGYIALGLSVAFFEILKVGAQ